MVHAVHSQGEGGENLLDISVLGREIVNIFAVIVDRTANRVVLLHGSDSYGIQRRE
jgi:hypothetical protein